MQTSRERMTQFIDNKNLFFFFIYSLFLRGPQFHFGCIFLGGGKNPRTVSPVKLPVTHPLCRIHITVPPSLKIASIKTAGGDDNATIMVLNRSTTFTVTSLETSCRDRRIVILERVGVASQQKTLKKRCFLSRGCR